MPISDAELADARRIAARIKDELTALTDKLHWWEIAIIGIGGALAIWAALATCTTLAAAITAATGGTGAPVAVAVYVKCILAALALILAFVIMLIKLIALGAEGGTIKGKVIGLIEVLTSGPTDDD